MPTDEELIDFFLNADADIIQYTTLEISHSEFSKTYRIVRNKYETLTATLETGQTVVFDYYPVEMKENETTDDLDYGLTIDFGDLGEIIPQELDRLSDFSEKPELIYRTFRSDDLSQPMLGPLTLEIQSIAFDKDGASISARMPSLNLNRTGEFYTVAEFPMLKGLL